MALQNSSSNLSGVSRGTIPAETVVTVNASTATSRIAFGVNERNRSLVCLCDPAYFLAGKPARGSLEDCVGL